MSCNTNPCSCPDTNCCHEQYDNCGCTNPTTFGCTKYTGSALPAIGVANNEDGDSLLVKIDSAIDSLKDDKGKVLVDATDTCPEYVEDKLLAGTNISFTKVGTGCDYRIRIDSVTGGTPVDVNVKTSVNDTVTGYLYNKITTGSFITKSIQNPGGSESVLLDLVLASMLSTDSGNQLTIGSDGRFKTAYSAPDGSETKMISGTGTIISGSGTSLDPYIISTNPSIQVARPCFDGVWKNLTLVVSGNPNVVYTSGAPQYRVRFDGTVEFRGQLTYNVAFGNYQSGNRKFTLTVASLPLSCLSLPELAGTVDMKSINYIDVPQASADQITQMYGYVIRRSSQNIIFEFQSSFTNATTKSMVVNFDGCQIHPLI